MNPGIDNLIYQLIQLRDDRLQYRIDIMQHGQSNIDPTALKTSIQRAEIELVKKLQEVGLLKQHSSAIAIQTPEAAARELICTIDYRTDYSNSYSVDFYETEQWIG